MAKTLIGYDKRGYRDVAISFVIHLAILLPFVIFAVATHTTAEPKFLKQVTIASGNYQANPHNIPPAVAQEAFSAPQPIPTPVRRDPTPPIETPPVEPTDVPSDPMEGTIPMDVVDVTETPARPETNIVIESTPTTGTPSEETRQNLDDFLNQTESAEDLFGAPTTTARDTPGAPGAIGDTTTSGVDIHGVDGRTLLAQPTPVYPLELRTRGAKGSVTLRFDVMPDGSVRNPIVTRGSEYSAFDQSAITALRQYRFNAISTDAIVTGEITMTFNAD